MALTYTVTRIVHPYWGFSPPANCVSPKSYKMFGQYMEPLGPLANIRFKCRIVTGSRPSMSINAKDEKRLVEVRTMIQRLHAAGITATDQSILRSQRCIKLSHIQESGPLTQAERSMCQSK